MSKLLAFAALAFLSSPALACEFNTDCEPGSQCLKTSGNIYGVCAGGIEPGNRNDRVPVEDPLDLNHSTGNTCSFDVDCGVNAKCVKSNGAIRGERTTSVNAQSPFFRQCS